MTFQEYLRELEHVQMDGQTNRETNQRYKYFSVQLKNINNVLKKRTIQVKILF